MDALGVWFNLFDIVFTKYPQFSMIKQSMKFAVDISKDMMESNHLSKSNRNGIFNGKIHSLLRYLSKNLIFIIKSNLFNVYPRNLQNVVIDKKNMVVFSKTIHTFTVWKYDGNLLNDLMGNQRFNIPKNKIAFSGL